MRMKLRSMLFSMGLIGKMLLRGNCVCLSSKGLSRVIPRLVERRSLVCLVSLVIPLIG